jgi:ankyrin repeat protein
MDLPFQTVGAFLQTRLLEDPGHLLPLDTTGDPVHGWTFLHVAIGQNLPFSIIEWLVNAGCSPTHASHDGRTPIDMALLHGGQRRDIADFLLAHADPLWSDKRGLTALHHAINRRATPAVVRLLEKGASLKARDKDGLTPVSFVHHDPETLTLLLGHGVDPNMRLESGQTLLDSNCAHEKTVGLLLSKGANPHNRDMKKRTVLHHLMGRNPVFSGSLSMLIEAGADVNAQDAKGNTPLHLAAGQGNQQLFSVLVNAGADTGLANGRGEYAVDRARPEIRGALEKILLQHRAPESTLRPKPFRL